MTDRTGGSDGSDATPFQPQPPTDGELSDAVLDELLAAFDMPGNVVELRPARTELSTEPTEQSTAPTELPTGLPTGLPAAAPAELLAGESGAGSPAGRPDARLRQIIVIGGGDELPDAVNLDEAGEERLRAVHGRRDDSDGRSTIVIGDELDASGAFDAVTVAPPSSMDPRVRARRIAVRRAEGRRRLLWVALAAGVVVVIAGVIAVFASSLFAVQRVDVEGNTYVDQARLQRVVDELKGTPVLLVDTGRAERELEGDPWVERAVVRTDFPHRAIIDIRERTPLATYAGSDGMFRVIDIDGRVLSVIPGQPVAYVLLTGTAPDVDAGGFAGPPYASAAELVVALPAELRSITRSIDVDAATGNLTLALRRTDDKTVEVRIGTVDQLENKLARVVQDVRAGIEDVVAIDASTDGISETKG